MTLPSASYGVSFTREFKCPQCEFAFKYQDDQRKVIRHCPHCGKIFTEDQSADSYPSHPGTAYCVLCQDTDGEYLNGFQENCLCMRNAVEWQGKRLWLIVGYIDYEPCNHALVWATTEEEAFVEGGVTYGGRKAWDVTKWFSETYLTFPRIRLEF